MSLELRCIILVREKNGEQKRRITCLVRGGGCGWKCNESPPIRRRLVVDSKVIQTTCHEYIQEALGDGVETVCVDG